MKEIIICYDICSPRRLARMHRLLKRKAVPLQHSVFLFTGSIRQLEKCLEEAKEIIDKKEDDLRAYPLPSRGLKARLGKPVLPEGIQLANMPSKW